MQAAQQAAPLLHVLYRTKVNRQMIYIIFGGKAFDLPARTVSKPIGSDSLAGATRPSNRLCSRTGQYQRERGTGLRRSSIPTEPGSDTAYYLVAGELRELLARFGCAKSERRHTLPRGSRNGFPAAAPTPESGSLRRTYDCQRWVLSLTYQAPSGARSRVNRYPEPHSGPQDIDRYTSAFNKPGSRETIANS